MASRIGRCFPVLIALVLGVASCALPSSVHPRSNRLTITVWTGADGRPVFQLSGATADEGAAVSRISVYEASPTGEWLYTDPMWKADAGVGTFVRVGQVAYGRAPEGFASTPARPLLPGRHYQVAANAAGIARAVEFATGVQADGTFGVWSCGDALARVRTIPCRPPR